MTMGARFLVTDPSSFAQVLVNIDAKGAPMIFETSYPGHTVSLYHSLGESFLLEFTQESTGEVSQHRIPNISVLYNFHRIIGHMLDTMAPGLVSPAYEHEETLHAERIIYEADRLYRFGSAD